MRAIKFRAWDAKYKYMNYKVMVGMYGDNVMDDENYTACSMWIEPKKVDYKCEPYWAHFEPYHKDILLMQYTGLKDKNGKEIYEGDIVIVTCYSYEQIESESTGEVVYSEALACFALSDGENGFATLSDLQGPFRTEYEVIGNIYDNPDLLGV